MEFKIATKQDVEAISQLGDELFTVLSELKDKLYNPVGLPEDFIISNIKSNVSDYILLIEDEKVIGYVLVEEKHAPIDRFFSFKEDDFAYIDEFVISPEYRAKGYGKKLMEEAKKWATKRNLTNIQLFVLSNNHSAKAFYESEGFEEFQTKYRMEITDL